MAEEDAMSNRARRGSGAGSAGSSPRRLARPLLAALALVVVSPACDRQGSASNRAPTGPASGAAAHPQAVGAVRIALIMKTLANPFFFEMKEGARKAQQETLVDLQVKTGAEETSIEQQIQLVEEEIEAKAKAIVIAPGDSVRLVPALKRAQDAGIRIVNIDSRLSPQAMKDAGMKPVPFISVDNEASAYLVAKHLTERVQAPAEAAILEGIRAADNAQQRRHGAERAFRASPNIEIVASETANWKVTEAYEVTQALLKAHPNLRLLFCSNDMMAIGAIHYLRDAGNTKVLVAGFDALEEAEAAIHAGTLVATFDQQAAQQGYLGILTAVKLLRGEQVPPETMVDGKLVTLQTLK
jgi:ribose transport system substrate-binding protein